MQKVKNHNKSYITLNYLLLFNYKLKIIDNLLNFNKDNGGFFLYLSDFRILKLFKSFLNIEYIISWPT